MAASVLVLAHASQSEALTHRVKEELSALGFAVEGGAAPATRRALAARIEAAHRVVLLWSRAARGTPALRAAARRARTKGTLVCVSLDAAPPPAGAKFVIRMPRSGAAWRNVLAKGKRPKEVTPPRAQSRPARARRDPALKITKQFPMTPLPKPRKAAPWAMLLLVPAVLVAAAGTVAYAQDAAFAERVNAIGAQVQTMVADLGG